MKSNVLKLNKETPAARLYDHFKNPPTEARWGGIEGSRHPWFLTPGLS